MFMVLDCGTTMSRIHIVDNQKKIVATGRKKVGVRDTSITGSRDALRKGVTELFYQVLEENGVAEDEIKFIIASGMITSEIGLIEIPHLVAPAGLKELAGSIYKAEPGEVLPMKRPVYFVRGIKNNFGENARADRLRDVDFMRGEEVQVMGILTSQKIHGPCTIVALSSHTKLIYVDENNRIAACTTTLSGQLFEALCTATSIGKSLKPCEGEQSGGYSDEELINIAWDCVQNAGLSRTMLMPRFMQVLLKTDADERITFIDAALATDDLKTFEEMRNKNMVGDQYIFYGHKSRCEMYEYMLKKYFDRNINVSSIAGTDAEDRMTVDGIIAVAREKQLF